MSKLIEIVKYHGIGNDFVMVADPGDALTLSSDDVRRLCDRRFGIGADGVIRVAPGRDGADLFMDYVNSDGSIGEMCGNGIRCLLVFARAAGMTQATEVEVGTRAGLKRVSLLDDGRVRVDMGPPVFEPDSVPVRWPGSDALHAKAELGGEVVEVACVSMGNPHAVLLVSDVAAAPVATLGPRLETHEMFPHKANIEFAKVVSPERIEMRVWERGSGETLACGTGACAVAVVARVLEGTAESVTVALPGGELDIEWHGDLTHPQPVLMTGPVVKVFATEVDLDALAAAAPV